jgi:hypothetical protein
MAGRDGDEDDNVYDTITLIVTNCCLLANCPGRWNAPGNLIENGTLPGRTAIQEALPTQNAAVYQRLFFFTACDAAFCPTAARIDLFRSLVSRLTIAS